MDEFNYEVIAFAQLKADALTEMPEWLGNRKNALLTITQCLALEKDKRERYELFFTSQMIREIRKLMVVICILFSRKTADVYQR